MHSKEDCIFCKIIQKEIPSRVVYENEKVIAFDDINPVAPVHVLIVPKNHIGSVSEIDEENVEDITQVHLAISEIMKRKNVSDFRLITNCGEGAGQTVMHLHYHFIGGKPLSNLV